MSKNILDNPGSKIEGAENLTLTVSLLEDVQKTLRTIISNPVFAEEGFRRLGRSIETDMIMKLKSTRTLTEKQIKLFDELAQKGSANLNLLSRNWSSFLTGTAGALTGLSMSIARANEQLRQQAAGSLRYGQTAFMPGGGTSLFGQSQYKPFAQTVQEQRYLLNLQLKYNKELSESSKQVYESMYTIFTAEGQKQGLSGQSLENYRQKMSTLIGSLGVLRGESFSSGIKDLTNSLRNYNLTSAGAVNLTQNLYKAFNENKLPSGGFLGNVGFISSNIAPLMGQQYGLTAGGAVRMLYNLQKEVGPSVSQQNLQSYFNMSLPYLGGTAQAVLARARLGGAMGALGLNAINPITGKQLTPGFFESPSGSKATLEDIISAFRAISTKPGLNTFQNGIMLSNLGLTPEALNQFAAPGFQLNKTSTLNTKIKDWNNGVLQSVNDLDKNSKNVLNNLNNVPDILDALVKQTILTISSNVPRGLGYAVGAAGAIAGGALVMQRLSGLKRAYGFVKSIGGMIDENGNLTATGKALVGDISGTMRGGAAITEAAGTEAMGGMYYTSTTMGGITAKYPTVAAATAAEGAEGITEEASALGKYGILFGKVAGVVGSTLAVGGALYEGYNLVKEISNHASDIQMVHTAISGILDALMLTPAAPIAAGLQAVNMLTSPEIANYVEQRSNMAKNRLFTSFALQNFRSLYPRGQAEFLAGIKSGKYSVSKNIEAQLTNEASNEALAESFIMQHGGSIGISSSLKPIAAHKPVTTEDIDKLTQKSTTGEAQINSQNAVVNAPVVYLNANITDSITGTAANQANQSSIRGAATYNEAPSG